MLAVADRMAGGPATVTIRTWQDGGIRLADVECFPTPTPGLVITPAWKSAGFTLTHAPTGCGVGWWPGADPEAIVACAIELGAVTDWTTARPPAGVLRDRARPVMGRWGGLPLPCAGPR